MYILYNPQELSIEIFYIFNIPIWRVTLTLEVIFAINKSEHFECKNFQNIRTLSLIKLFLVLTKKSVPKFKIILANKTWIVLLHFASYVSLGHYSVYALSEVDAHKCPIVWLS